MSDTTRQSEAWQRHAGDREKTLQDLSRKLIDERRHHAGLRDTLTALVKAWRDEAETPPGLRPRPGGHLLQGCADQVDEALSRAGQS